MNRFTDTWIAWILDGDTKMMKQFEIEFASSSSPANIIKQGEGTVAQILFGEPSILTVLSPKSDVIQMRLQERDPDGERFLFKGVAGPDNVVRGDYNREKIYSPGSWDTGKFEMKRRDGRMYSGNNDEYKADPLGKPYPSGPNRTAVTFRNSASQNIEMTITNPQNRSITSTINPSQSIRENLVINTPYTIKLRMGPDISTFRRSFSADTVVDIGKFFA